MSGIDIRHAHALPMAEARRAVEQLAHTLTERFGVEHAWENDAMHLNGPGVDGRIELGPEQLRVTARLGFLLSAMKGPIEAEIRRVLGKHF